MSLSDELQDAITELNGDMAVGGVAPYFDWRGKNIPCVPSTLEAGIEIEIGGRAAKITLALIVSCTEFHTIDSTIITIDSEAYTADDDTPSPVAGKKLTYMGRTYRILSANVSGPRSHYKLVLTDPYK